MLIPWIILNIGKEAVYVNSETKLPTKKHHDRCIHGWLFITN